MIARRPSVAPLPSPRPDAATRSATAPSLRRAGDGVTGDPAGGASRLLVEQLLDLTERRQATSPLMWRVVRVAIALALAKAALQAVSYLSGYPIAAPGAPLAPSVHVLMFAGFLAIGLVMLVAGRRDRRAVYLGGFFVIVATAFARASGRLFAADLTGAATLPLRVLATENLDAFLPLLLWLFAAEFPRTMRASRLQRLMTEVIAGAAVVTTILEILENVAHFAGARWIGADQFITALGVTGRGNLYWGATFGLTLAAFPVIVARSRRAVGQERLRATWFIVSLLIGLGPMFTEVILESLSPRFEAWAQGVRPALGFALFSLCLTIPVTSAYAVVYKRVLAVRIVLRRALQCALAKYVFVAACLVPMVTMAARMYIHRDYTVVAAAADPVVRIAFLLTLAGLAALIFTERILARIDARFFAPRYDAQAVVEQLTIRLARAADAAAVAELIRRALAPALCAVKTTVANVTDRRGDSRSPDRLPDNSTIVDVLTTTVGAGLFVSDRLLRAVSPSDAAWLAGTGGQVLAPIRASDGRVLAVIALAERHDEQPYSRQDTQLVAQVAAAAALRLEHLRLASVQFIAPAGPVAVDEAAFECPSCGALTEPRASSRCDLCGDPLELAYLPLTLHRKFHLDRRLGRGGMGIVYLATDLNLRRLVALKTLPAISGGAEQRMRAEARTMAQFSQANLASIFDYEVWRDRSILVVEYLEGGTLSALLAREGPSVAQVVRWTQDLCDALVYLHGHHVLHGDIKPSNIAFDRRGTPKFLDFGLSAAFLDDNRGRREPHDAPSPGRWGTPRYQCPEVGVMPACPHFDLWSLAVVMYEALTAQRLQAAAPARRSFVDVREIRPDVPAEVARLLANALHSDVGRRARTALEFSVWLSHVQPVR